MTSPEPEPLPLTEREIAFYQDERDEITGDRLWPELASDCYQLLDRMLATISHHKARADALAAQVAVLERNQRTPGTVDVCERWGSAHCSDHPQSDFDVSLCRHRNCPRSVSPSP